MSMGIPKGERRGYSQQITVRLGMDLPISVKEGYFEELRACEL